MGAAVTMRVCVCRSQRERQTQKEETQVLTEKLDQEWKSIQNLLARKTPREREEEKEKPKVRPLEGGVCSDFSNSCFCLAVFPLTGAD